MRNQCARRIIVPIDRGAPLQGNAPAPPAQNADGAGGAGGESRLPGCSVWAVGNVIVQSKSTVESGIRRVTGNVFELSLDVGITRGDFNWKPSSR